MKLSVIIPAKNEEAALPKTLEALKAQSRQADEIIVADAFSTDRTRDIAASFGATVIDGGMPGPGRNMGARVASGDVFLFLDADTVLPAPDFLAEALGEIEKNALDMAAVRLQPDNDSLVDHALHDFYNSYLHLVARVRPHGAGSCLFVRAEPFRAANGFDEEIVLAEDHDLIQRLHRRGFKYGILDCEPVTTSDRRFQKDGRLNIAVRYAYSEFQILRGRRLTKIPFSYEMGGETPDEKR
ncbi:MAG TPA: glycosyltransferase [Verrucomicrobiae bacterium]|nr:glycosyltransferase [Verrucomicrobiae bacterium]